jgi:hypothetical protein
VEATKTDLDDLVLAMARWLDAAQTEEAHSIEKRVSALEEARHRLSSCLESLPLGMRAVARRGWAQSWATE